MLWGVLWRLVDGFSQPLMYGPEGMDRRWKNTMWKIFGRNIEIHGIIQNGKRWYCPLYHVFWTFLTFGGVMIW